MVLQSAESLYIYPFLSYNVHNCAGCVYAQHLKCMKNRDHREICYAMNCRVGHIHAQLNVYAMKKICLLLWNIIAQNIELTTCLNRWRYVLQKYKTLLSRMYQQEFGKTRQRYFGVFCIQHRIYNTKTKKIKQTNIYFMFLKN